ncbi:MAG: cytochrome c biogenesis protein ResB [Candidatus Krumholzibacteriota bacterium]|nr:cytochrome c biogenesis protein ResB [Candidatus Krumholzibacteriota bacterium]
MAASDRKIGRNLISQRLAITVISVLFGATAAGWLFTEIFPYDFKMHLDEYIGKWGVFPVKICSWLKVYDPFHSFWYAGILILFFVVLLLCIISRWRNFVLRSFKTAVTAARRELPDGAHGSVIFYADPAESEEAQKDPLIHYAKKHGIDFDGGPDLKERIYRHLSSVMGRSGFRSVMIDREGDIFFSAVRGRWKYMGNFLFHAGLLIITAGGMMGSIMGSTELLYGKTGDMIPLYKSGYSVRIDDFRILLSAERRIDDYITVLSVVDSGGETVKTRNIEVNHPLAFEGFHIYQSSYYTSDEEFSRAGIRCVTDDGEIIILVLSPGEKSFPPDSTFALEAVSFFPDFRMGEKGPYSASPMMRNPALEIRLSDESQVFPGYLFALHPRFNSHFEGFYSMTLEDIEPVYLTGLQISSDPGSPVLWAGMIIASLGLLLLYSFNYRVINGYIGKDRMIIYAAEGRWNISRYDKYERIEKQIREMLPGIISKNV